jgi:magnesium transporter
VPAAPSRTAEDLVEADVPRVSPQQRVEEALGALLVEPFARTTEIAVVEDGRLEGVVAIEQLYAAAGETKLIELARPAVSVETGDGLEAATRMAARSGARSLAVVDRAGRFIGFVPPERLLALLEFEHEEDMARLGGFLSRARLAVTASEEAIPRRLWHRLPWLAIGLAGAMGSAVIVGWFEEDLRRQVLLALFVPAVVYMADAVGAQTETVVIRGMAAGVSIRNVVARELTTGAIIGTLIGGAFFPFAFAVWENARVAAAVALALAVSCSVATIVAMALPYAIAARGRDPAFGSGPLATVIQDLLSIIAYFVIATILVH